MDITQALSEWRSWNLPSLTERPQLLENLCNGLNHKVYRLVSPSNPRQTSILKINVYPNSGLVTQAWANQFDLAPEIYFIDANENYCVMQDLGEPLAKINVSEHDLELIAFSLSRLHRQPIRSVPLERFNLKTYCENLAHELGGELPSIQQALTPAFETFATDSNAWTVCHHDLISENCFINDNSAWFIDWEYAHINNPWFDLASILSYFDLSITQAKHFLSVYKDGWQEKIESDIYYAAQALVQWCDLLWRRQKFSESNAINLKQGIEKVNRYSQYLGIKLLS